MELMYKKFEVVSRTAGHGCVHAVAPHGCDWKVVKCTRCGYTTEHQCGNNALMALHQCEHDEE
jgi:hypothetical protein